MLIQFLVENFLSFKDETVFSLLAPPEETRGVVEIPAHGLRLMRIAAFYGANASGKSNLIAAMDTARKLIARERPSDAKLPARFFRLDPAAQTQPSRFQFDFIVTEIRYTYVLAFTEDNIVAEALYRKLPKIDNEEMVFEREAPAQDGEHRVTLGPMFDTTDEDDRQFARFTARGANTLEPLLRRFAKGNVPGFANIHAWFSEALTIIYASAHYTNLVRELHEDPAMVRFYSDILATWGTGIQEVTVQKTTIVNRSELIRELNKGPQDPKATARLRMLLLAEPNSEAGFDTIGEGPDQALLEIKLAHTTRPGFRALFELQDESDGTQRLLHLLPVLFNRTKDSGLCTVIDELDRSLHTSLTRHFVKEFLSLGSGTQTQLIFTTHDTNLLNGQLLPIPAIWFVEKDDDGASHIYSLVEYKPDQIEQLLEHLEEGYLQGRFGAIPFIADRNNLRWQVRQEKPAQ